MLLLRETEHGRKEMSDLLWQDIFDDAPDGEDMVFHKIEFHIKPDSFKTVIVEEMWIDYEMTIDLPEMDPKK